MQFLASLFGGAENSILTATLALVAVIALILIVLWVMKLMFKATGNVGRARNRRLSVVDQLAIDPKRQLVIVRRDNVEHLVLIGGPQDVLLEANIPVEAQPRPAVQQRRAQAPVPVQQLGDHMQEHAPPSPSPLDRLRGGGQRRSPSLRHTGLMRPVSRMEPALNPANPDNPGHSADDSAKTHAIDSPGEQAFLGTQGEHKD